MSQQIVGEGAEADFTVTGYLAQLGVLRCGLLTVTLIVTVLAIGAPAPSFSGDVATMVRGGVVPPLVPLLLAVLMFDTLMARVWLSEASGAEAGRLRRIIGSNLTVAALLVLAWGRFFYELIRL